MNATASMAMAAYAGSIDAMVLRPTDGTNSPLMNKPNGCSYFCPLGVVIFLDNDMVEAL